MNVGSQEQTLDQSPQSDEPAQHALAPLITDPTEMWERYESRPDCYDGVALSIQRSWMGIITGGAITACLIFVSVVIYEANVLYLSPVRLAFAIPLAAVLFIVGGVLAAFWSVFAILVVMVLNLSFWESFDRRTAVAICGGGTGFLATYWPLFSYKEHDWLMIAILGLVVLAGTTMCQIGGLWWGSREYALFNPPRDPDVPKQSFQFKITHIMIAMVWFGVVFALDQIVDHHEILLMFGIYIVLQGILLGMDWLIFRRRKTTRLHTI